MQISITDDLRTFRVALEPLIFLEIGNVIKNPNLTEYTRSSMEGRIARAFASFIGNQSQAIIKIFEDNYLKPGTADDDHLAWLQFIVDVSICFSNIF
jgi:hypothetical protein